MTALLHALLVVVTAAAPVLGTARDSNTAPPSFAHVATGGLQSTSVPVLLVPGWLESDRDLAALRIRLVAAGWDAEAVETLAFENPVGGNREHADEIESAIARIRGITGSEEVDIVAHSMGGLATRWYLLTREGASVRRVVFIASPHHGTYSAYLAWGESRAQMKPGSAFLETLNAAPPVPDGVEAITVRTPVDTHILPPESAMLDGYPDYLVCCPSHGGLLRNADVFRIVRRFLEEGYEDDR